SSRAVSSKQLAKAVALRKRMSAVLNERLGILTATLAAPRGPQPLHALHVLVNPVVGSEPLSLRGVAGEHFNLLLHLVANADVERGRNQLAGVWILGLDGIAIVEPGNVRVGVARQARRVGNGVAERGTPR